MAIEVVTLPNLRKRVFITTGTTEWPDPGDWNDGDNAVECVGSGYGGGGGSGADFGGGGGGGGAYAVARNIAPTFPVQVNIRVHSPPSATQFGGDGSMAPSATLCSAPSANITAGSIGGSGGSAAQCHPTGFSGGSGGNGGMDAPASGGGAGGPNGAGGNGSAGSWNVIAAGGAAGGSATQWDANHGVGRGGGNARVNPNVDAEPGFAYGGGGGGTIINSWPVGPGDGAPGLIVVTYFPLKPTYSLFEDITNPSGYGSNTGTFGTAFFPHTLIRVHGVRYWADPSQGVTTGELWDIETQSVIASGVAAAPTEMGWRTILFDAPVERDHGQRFVTSYRPHVANSIVWNIAGAMFIAANPYNRPGPVSATAMRARWGVTPGFPDWQSTNDFYFADIVFSTDSWMLGLVKGAGGQNLALISPDDDAELDNPAWLQLRNGPIQATEVVKIPRVDWSGLP